MVQQNCQGETTISDIPHLGGNNLKGVKISVENFEREGPLPTETKDDAEARKDFFFFWDSWMKGNSQSLTTDATTCPGASSPRSPQKWCASPRPHHGPPPLLPRAHWQRRTSCRKFLWFHDSSSQSSQWSLWISKQSSICSRGAGLGHPMDPVVSVQNRNFSGNTKELAKVLGAEQETKSQLPWHVHGIWQSLWRSLLDSLYVDTTQIGNKWDCWESSAQCERRYLCSIVAIRSGWQMVGRFYGMWNLSAKHSRSLIWWGDSIRKALWRTIWRTNHSVWFTGWVLPISAKDQSRIHPSIWKESLTWIVPWIRSVRGENLEGWHNGCRHCGVEMERKLIIPRENGKFVFPVADGRIKFIGGDQELRTPTLIRE